MPSPELGDSFRELTYKIAAEVGSPPPELDDSLYRLTWKICQGIATGGGGGGSASFSSLTGSPSDNTALATALDGKVDVSGDTMTGPLVNSTNSSASTPVNRLTGTWFTGGSATTTKPHFLIEPSGTTSNNWSASGTGFGINAASGFSGNFVDFQLNGANKFSVSKDGAIRMTFFGENIAIYDTDNVTKLWWTAIGRTFATDFNTKDNRTSLGGEGAGGLFFGSGTNISWSNNGAWFGGSIDTTLGRVAAGVLAQGAGNILRLGVTAASGVALASTHTLQFQDTSGTNYYVLARTSPT